MRDIWNQKIYWSFDDNEWAKKVRVYVLSGNTVVGEENLRPLTYRTSINVDSASDFSNNYILTYFNPQTYYLSVDWGDSSDKETISYSDNGYLFDHNYTNGMYTLSITYPEKIIGFSATGCSITTLSNMADSITTLNLAENNTTSISSFNLPKDLVYLNLCNNNFNQDDLDELLYYIISNYAYFNYLDIRMITLESPSNLPIELFANKFTSCTFLYG